MVGQEVCVKEDSRKRTILLRQFGKTMWDEGYDVH
jgi:hypothetical protein